MHPHWFKLAPSLISRAFTDESCAELCKTQHQFHSELCIPLCILKPGIWGQYLQDILSIFWMVICYSNLGSNQGWHPLQYINTILKLLPSLRCKTLYYITWNDQLCQDLADYGKKWPDLWPNEIVGMAMAIPEITSMTTPHVKYQKLEPV